jgi:hypothetical protein
LRIHRYLINNNWVSLSLEGLFELLLSNTKWISSMESNQQAKSWGEERPSTAELDMDLKRPTSGEATAWVRTKEQEVSLV